MKEFKYEECPIEESMSIPRKRITRFLKGGGIISFSAPLDYTEEQINDMIQNFEAYKSGEFAPDDELL
jgi:hypothetical protein